MHAVVGSCDRIVEDVRIPLCSCSLLVLFAARESTNQRCSRRVKDKDEVMEVAGLAVGIIALVSGFKECIDLIGYISDARNLFRDASILNCQLDIEKTLLLQWCERVGLVATTCDPRLNDEGLRLPVGRKIDSIKLLLNDSDGLVQWYGLQEDDRPESSSDDNPTLNRARSHQFIEDFRILSLRTGLKRKGVPDTRKLRWVVKDKEKFEKLVEKVSYFVAKLYDLFPDRPQIEESIMEKDLRNLNSWTKFLVMLRASKLYESKFYEVVDRKFQTFCRNRALECLWFRTMDSRRVDISSPEYESFRWVLKSPNAEGAKWNELSAWLCSRSGIC